MAPQAPDREKALELALAQIEKNHGKGAVMRLGDEVRQPIAVIPTGSIALDVALGIGGLPRGRVVEIAYLGDVYILEAHRGRGLAKWLVRTIMNDPELQGLRRWILLTADAHGLYRPFGWKEIADPSRWMEIHDRQVYSGPSTRSAP
jgi:GNAT superfamily N-acetyltransferase